MLEPGAQLRGLERVRGRRLGGKGRHYWVRPFPTSAWVGQNFKSRTGQLYCKPPPDIAPGRDVPCHEPAVFGGGPNTSSGFSNILKDPVAATCKGTRRWHGLGTASRHASSSCGSPGGARFGKLAESPIVQRLAPGSNYRAAASRTATLMPLRMAVGWCGSTYR